MSRQLVTLALMSPHEVYIMKDKFYYKDGTTSSEYDTSKALHRTDGPAVEWGNGDRFWLVDGKRHRVDGPAVERANGTKHWYVDGKRHRIDAPAAEYADGGKRWYVDCKRHRLDGPAEEWASGGRYWWADGEEYSEGEFNKFIQEVKELPKVLRLIDTREWVRKL